MTIACLDLEGVLVPEIWIAFAEKTNLPELRLTTRDEPDYDKLMRYRLNILKREKLGLNEIKEVIAKIEPFEGAKSFQDDLKKMTAKCKALDAQMNELASSFDKESKSHRPQQSSLQGLSPFRCPSDDRPAASLQR